MVQVSRNKKTFEKIGFEKKPSGTALGTQYITYLTGTFSITQNFFSSNSTLFLYSFWEFFPQRTLMMSANSFVLNSSIFYFLSRVQYYSHLSPPIRKDSIKQKFKNADVFKSPPAETSQFLFRVSRCEKKNHRWYISQFSTDIISSATLLEVHQLTSFKTGNESADFLLNRKCIS